MTGFQPVIVDDEVRCFINFNRVTLLTLEQGDGHGYYQVGEKPDDEHGYYQVVAYDRFPRNSTDKAKVVFGHYKSRDAAARAVDELYRAIVRFNSD